MDKVKGGKREVREGTGALAVQAVRSLEELQPFVWIIRHFNPNNINNRREQIRGIVDDVYVIITEKGGYEIVTPYYYELLIKDRLLFRAKE